MTQQQAMNGWLVQCQEQGNSLGAWRVAISEVQICGIPKPLMTEVAPTP